MYVPPLYIFPLASGLLLPLTFLLCYTIAVSLGHTQWGWPYISDTTTRPPESCIFSQLINVGALLVAITFYIRYKQVAEYCSSYQLPRRVALLNVCSLGAGWGGALGLSLFGNFQETEVSPVHWLGFYLCFLLAIAWSWATVMASSSLHPLATSCRLLLLRACLASLATLTFLTMLVAGLVARSLHTGQDPASWAPTDGGWEWHCLSTASEWIMAASLGLVILSLVPEFRNIGLVSPRIRLIIDRSHSVLQIEEGDLDGYSSSGSLVA